MYLKNSVYSNEFVDRTKRVLLIVSISLSVLKSNRSVYTAMHSDNQYTAIFIYTVATT